MDQAADTPSNEATHHALRFLFAAEAQGFARVRKALRRGSHARPVETERTRSLAGRSSPHRLITQARQLTAR